MPASSFATTDLTRYLKTTGVYLQTGTFVTRVQSDIPSVIEGIALLYSDYPIAFDGQFADFHVRLGRPRNLRRWIGPQALFLCDGVSAFKPLPLVQAFPMLEWGLNWCVSTHAHSYLMIHAAVIEKGGNAAILPAPPGSGKSTLCAALIHHGWRLLSDELTLVRITDGAIVPLPRPVSLKNRSIDVIREFAPAAIMSRKVSDTIKGTVAHMKPPQESVARAMEQARPAWVIFPKYEEGAAARLESLPRPHAFMRVADNAFNYSVLGLTGFELLAKLIDVSQCYEFTYSHLDDAVKTFASLAS